MARGAQPQPGRKLVTLIPGLNVALASILFGSLPLFSALLRDQGVSSPVQAGTRLAVAWAILGGFLKAFRGRINCPPREVAVSVVVYGMLGILGSYLTTSAAVATGLPISQVSLLSNVHPVFILILSRVFLHEKPTLSRLFAGSVTLTGVLVFLRIWEIGVLPHSNVVGYLFALSNAFFYATYIVLSRVLQLNGYHPLQILHWGLKVALLAFVGICATYVLAATDSAMRWLSIASIRFDWRTVVYSVGMGLFATVLPHCLLVTSLSKVESLWIVPFLALEPVSAATLGILFLHETLNMWQVIGGALIATGAVLATIDNQRGSQNFPVGFSLSSW